MSLLASPTSDHPSSKQQQQQQQGSPSSEATPIPQQPPTSSHTTTAGTTPSLQIIKAALLSASTQHAQPHLGHSLQSVEGYRRASIAAPEFQSAVAPSLPLPLPLPPLGLGFAASAASVAGVATPLGGASPGSSGVGAAAGGAGAGTATNLSPHSAQAILDSLRALTSYHPGIEGSGITNNNNSLSTLDTSNLASAPGGSISQADLAAALASSGATATVSALVDPIDYSQLSKELFSFSPLHELSNLPGPFGSAGLAGGVTGGPNTPAQHLLAAHHHHVDPRRASIATATLGLTIRDGGDSPCATGAGPKEKKDGSTTSVASSSGNAASSDETSATATAPSSTTTTAEKSTAKSPLGSLHSPSSSRRAQQQSGNSIHEDQIGPTDFVSPSSSSSSTANHFVAGCTAAAENTEMSPAATVTSEHLDSVSNMPSETDAGASPRKAVANSGGADGSDNGAAAARSNSTNGASLFSDPFASAATGRTQGIPGSSDGLGGGGGDTSGYLSSNHNNGNSSYPSPHPHAHQHHVASFSGPSSSAQAGGGYASSQYAMPAHILHRASISGPIMQHHYSAVAGGPSSASSAGMQNASSGSSGNAAAAAPPLAGDMAAWAHAHGGARPHTADGMFGPFGYTGGFPPTAASTAGSLTPTGTHAGGTSSSADDSAYGSTPRDGSGTHASHFLFNYVASHGGSDTSFSNGDSSFPGGHGDEDIDGELEGSTSHAGPAHKKRPRRRYDEIERLYPCNHPGCTKSYGTLNHLNAHVAMQGHGAKRLPSEFKDMRKAWRKAKREEEQRRMAAAQQTVNAHAAMAASALERQHRVNSHPSLSYGSMPPPALPPYATGGVGHAGPYGANSSSAAAAAAAAAAFSRGTATPSILAPGSNPNPFLGHPAYGASAAAAGLAPPPPPGTGPGAAAAAAAAAAAMAGLPHPSAGASNAPSDYESRYQIPSVPGGLGAYLMQGHHRGSI